MVTQSYPGISEEAKRDLESAIDRVESQVLARYPEAEFKISCVAEDEVHLLAFTAVDTDRELMMLADDEVDKLLEEHGIFLAVLPLLLRK